MAEVQGVAGRLVDTGSFFPKLKPGPGLSAAQVVADQRRRLHGAVITLVDRGGPSGLRVRALSRAAGVSTSTFYKHFANTDQCFASAFGAAVQGAIGQLTGRKEGLQGSSICLTAAVEQLLDFFAREPLRARVMLLEVFSGGPAARERIALASGELERHVAECLRTTPASTPAPRHMVAGMTAGLLRVARATVAAGRGEELPNLAMEISDWMLSLPDPEVVTLLRASHEAESSRRNRVTVPSPCAEVTPDDRERSLRAAARIASAEGFARLTAVRIRSDAGVSRRSFDSVFRSLEECFLDAVETVAVDALERASDWSSQTPNWAVRTCRTVFAVSVQAARDMPQARLAFLEIFAPGKDGLLRKERLVTKTAAALRKTIPPEVRPSSLVVEASVAATWHIAQADIAAGRGRQLPQVAPLFSYIILTPIIGPQTATRAITEASYA